MKSLRALFVVFAALLSLAVVNAGQGALTMNAQLPVSFTFFDQCTGENVAVSGTVHIVSTSTATDSKLSGTFHSNLQATGIGQTSGLAYQESVVANSRFETSLINGQAMQTFVGRITIVAPGAQNNQTSPIIMHTTMNANGEVTSLKVEAPTVVCQ
jgi:hypothetical protein